MSAVEFGELKKVKDIDEILPRLVVSGANVEHIWLIVEIQAVQTRTGSWADRGKGTPIQNKVPHGRVAIKRYK